MLDSGEEWGIEFHFSAEDKHNALLGQGKLAVRRSLKSRQMISVDVC